MPSQLKYEVPEILYEVDAQGNQVSQIPYIEVPVNKQMPPVLFIFEYRHTGETEPDEKGREVPVLDQIPHKYLDMEFLKEKLPSHINDIVRTCIGLEPLKKAQSEGQKVLDKVNENIEKLQKAKKD